MNKLWILCRQKIYIQNGYYASPRYLVEEIQKSTNFQYGLTLKNSNATITISYGENSARVKLDVQDPIKVKIILPQANAETLGVDRNEPRSDKRDLLAIIVKSEIFTKKERPSCCEQLQKI